MVATKETHAYRSDSKTNGTLLTPQQRENLIKPYLPSPPNRSRSSSPSDPWRIRAFLKIQIHFFIFTMIHTLFSLYMRLRQIYHALVDRAFAILYYHHRALELIRQDVRGLNRIPKHISVVLELKGEERGSARLEGLMEEVAEISAWCACVGIPLLSVYEKTGREPRFLGDALFLMSNRHLEGLSADDPSHRFFETSCLFWSSNTFSASRRTPRPGTPEWRRLREQRPIVSFSR